MDDASRIATYQQWLRVKFRTSSTTPDIVGLRKLIDTLGGGEASDAVVITGQSYEGGQASGTLVLEPMAKLTAALAVLAEVDPTNSPPERPNYAYARFGSGIVCPSSS